MDERLEQIFEELSERLSEEERVTVPRKFFQPRTSESKMKALNTKVKLLEEKHELKEGDFVRWKSGLKNKKYPKEGEPAYVLEVLEKQIIKEDKDPGSPYFREPLDIVLAFLEEEDGDLLIFHYDSRRFEKIS
jgi:hypothetical protein